MDFISPGKRKGKGNWSNIPKSQTKNIAKNSKK